MKTVNMMVSMIFTKNNRDIMCMFTQYFNDLLLVDTILNEIKV